MLLAYYYKYIKRSRPFITTHLFIASDHGGYALKKALISYLKSQHTPVKDLGITASETTDYPQVADTIANALAKNPKAMGILICGTGIGVSIRANRHSHIRAALCHNAETARLARSHNNANVLCLGGRILSDETAIACLHEFLITQFDADERHVRRINQL